MDRRVLANLDPERDEGCISVDSFPLVFSSIVGAQECDGGAKTDSEAATDGEPAHQECPAIEHHAAPPASATALRMRS